MESFVWNKQFETGIEDVDQQHLKLVEGVNQFAVLVNSGQDSDAALDAILGELGEYAAFHFLEEEELMDEYGVDRRHIEHHKMQHSQFIDKLTEMWDSRAALEHPGEALGDYLSSWLASHILDEDQSMARQIFLIKKGTPADEAFESEQPSK
jgi:hemerythrin